MNASTSAAFASWAWADSSGWPSSVTRAPAAARRRVRAPATVPSPPLSPTPQGGGLEPTALRLAHRRDGGEGLVAGGHPEQLVDRQPTGDPVDGELDVALEHGDGRCRVVPEDPVDAAGVEAQRAQPSLEIGDVVAAQHRVGAVEGTITERQPSLDEGGPGLSTGDAIDADASLALEGLNRCARRGPEGAFGIGDRAHADPGEPSLEIGDGRAG